MTIRRGSAGVSGDRWSRRVVGAVLGVVVVAVAGCAPPVDGGGSTAVAVAGGERERPYAEHRLVTAWPRDLAQVRLLWRLSEHVVSPHDPGLGEHQVLVKSATLQRLQAAGVALQIQAVDVQALVDESYRALAAPAGDGLRPHSAHAAMPGKLGIFGPYFSQVQPLDAIFAYLDELAAASAGRATVVTVGKSVQGRDLRALRIAVLPGSPERASVIITGTQHAREWASPMVVSGFADALVRQYDVDPRVKEVVDALEIFILPVSNPDGYVASHSGMRMQRKNMNPRCNVDLNRNWGQWWGMGTPTGGCDEETFPGAGAFSEPETAAISKLALSLPRLRFYMDYHSAANQVMYPLCFNQSRSPDVDEDKAWTQAYVKAFAGVNGASIPSVSCFGIGGGEGGCSTDWFRSRLPNGIEVELRPGQTLFGFGLTNDLVLPFVEENWAGWITVMEKVADKYPTRPVPAPGSGGDGGGSGDGDGGGDVGDAPLPVVDAGVDRPAPLPPAPDAAPSPVMDAAKPPSPVEPGASSASGGCAVGGRPAPAGQVASAALSLLGLLALGRARRRARGARGVFTRPAV